MLTLIASVALQTSGAPTVTDFYPVTAGSSWVYEEEVKSDKRVFKNRITDKVSEHYELEGNTVYDLISSDSSGTISKTTYTVADNKIQFYFPSSTKPSDKDGDPPVVVPKIMYPVFLVAEKSESWSYFGMTPYDGGAIPMSMDATSKRVGMRTVLGNKVECVEVTTMSELNLFSGTDFAPKSGKGLTSKVVAIYARGIGLVELKEVRQLEKQKGEISRKLVSYTIK